MGSDRIWGQKKTIKDIFFNFIFGETISIKI